MDIKSKQVCSF